MSNPTLNCHRLAGPLGVATGGRLVFASGAGDVTLDADPALPDLYRAYFERHIPGVRLRDGTLTIQYRHFPLFNWLVYTPEPVAEITLNGSIPWEIEFRDGVSRLAAELGALPLRSLDLGSVGHALVGLPRPAGAVFVHVAGGVSDLTLRRPPGVAARVRIAGGAARAWLDGQQLGPSAGDLQWQTPGYDGATDRYDISIAGGA
jgi:hypothetical protein